MPKQRRDLTDVGALKALAHPLRQRMITWLRRNGPATSAMLAEQFDADRGATSYQLRQLARYGFITDDTERSAGRRRYWRAVPEDLRLAEPSGLDHEARAAAETVELLWQHQAEADRSRFHSDLVDDPDAYGDFGAAAMGSYAGLRLTAGQLREFAEEYIALLNRWERPAGDEPADSRHITVLFQAFPTPDETRPR